jgi:ribosome-associated heat shock protein Hsp15
MRLDVWLDVTCLFKTRSEAKKACEGGKVHINGQAARPHRDLKVGDELDITRPAGRRQKIAVRGLAEQHMKKADAKLLYEDLTPKPSPEEIELRRLIRLSAPLVRPKSAGAPDRRERRAIRRFKERG